MSKLKIGILSFRIGDDAGAALAAKLNTPLAIICRRTLINAMDGVAIKNVWELIDESDIIMVSLSPRTVSQMTSEIDVIEALEEKYPDKIWVLNMICDNYSINAEYRARLYEIPNMRSYITPTTNQYNLALTTMTNDAIEFASEINDIWNMKELGVIIEHYGFAKNIRNMEDDKNE